MMYFPSPPFHCGPSKTAQALTGDLTWPALQDYWEYPHLSLPALPFGYWKTWDLFRLCPLVCLAG